MDLKICELRVSQVSAYSNEFLAINLKKIGDDLKLLWYETKGEWK